MLRYSAIFILFCVAPWDICLSCECTNTERPCEYLTSDAVFVGRVVEIVAVKHPMGENSWPPRYSMCSAVEEPPKGDLGAGVTIETGEGIVERRCLSAEGI
jgi:hypothetical protein